MTQIQDFDWGKYVDLAERSLDDPNFDRESAERSAISRAYYGAFNMAKNYALNNGLVISKGEQHSSKIHYLTGLFYRQSGQGKIYEMLNRLRKERNITDYQSKFENTESVLALFCVSKAKEIINQIHVLETGV